MKETAVDTNIKKDLHIIYVSKLCSTHTYNTIFQLSGQKLIPQQQKYNRLMAEGLSAHPGVSVTAVSTLPITRHITKKLFFRKSVTIENNVEYRMVGTVNFPIIRLLVTLLATTVQIWQTSKPNLKRVIICDTQNITLFIAALTVSWLKKIKTVGIVTDVPGCLYLKRSKWSVFLTRILLNRVSSYLFLTEQMNSVINMQNRPYIIIEGQTDSKLINKKNELSEKNHKCICMYTGTVHRVYGIKLLVDAFLLADISGAVLTIYGTGDYEEELVKLSLQHETILYNGILPNEQIVEEQIKATLLINPRPTSEEYTKYSFPSKNMEYIASGTPLLTTKLPGMPDEYLPYVYLFEEESVEGYAQTLRKVLSLPAGELHAKGAAAKAFAMQYKNNITQAGKLLQMIRENVL